MIVLRILLLVVISLVVVVMICAPAFYDSKRGFSSRRDFHAAQRQHESAPGVETQRELNAARLAMDKAKRLDRRDIFLFEISMFAILGVSVYAFFRAGKGGKEVFS